MRILRRIEAIDTRTATEREIDSDYDELVTRILGRDALDADKIVSVSDSAHTYVHDPSDIGYVGVGTYTLSPASSAGILQAIRCSYDEIPLDPSE